MTLKLPEFYTLHRFDLVESTNATAKRLADEGAPEGTLVVAGEQSQGRGRSGRNWASPVGNLYLSLLLRPKESAAVAAQLSFVVALSVYDVLAPILNGHEMRLKWPNDVLVDDRKISGILLESSALSDASLAWLIIGVGINVSGVPGAVAKTATCLHDLGCQDFGVDDTLAGFSQTFWCWLEQWRNHGFAPIKAAWLEKSGGPGQALRVRVGRERFEGIFEDLDDDGALILRLPDNRVRRVTAGEVFFAA